MTPVRDSSSRSTGEEALLYRLSFLSVVLIAVGMYWKSIDAPFIQDDWSFLYAVMFKGQMHFLLQRFTPWAGGFCRPVGSLYLLVLYNLFRLNPVGYHILALAIHAVNSCLVVLLLERLTHDRFVAWGVGIFYAASTLVHVDTLFWVVGAYDLLGAFFFILSFYFFMGEKGGLSLLFFVLAVLTKEATLILPLILAAYLLFVRPGAFRRPLRRKLTSSLLLLRYHLIVMVLTAASLCIFVLPSISASGRDPYGTQFGVSILAGNFGTYGKWCLEGILPLLVYPVLHEQLMVGLLGAAIIVHLWHGRRTWRLSTFFLCWYVFGLLPVLPLAEHAFRYYSTYSLPAFFAFFIIPTMWVPESRRQIAAILVSVLIVADVYAGTTFLVMLDERWADIPVMAGTNNPARKAGVVRTVSAFFHSTYTDIPDSTIFIVDWFNTGPIGGNAAICIWYNNPSLRVVEVQQLQGDSTKVSFDESLSNFAETDSPQGVERRRYIWDPDRVVLLECTGGVIIPRKFK